LNSPSLPFEIAQTECQLLTTPLYLETQGCHCAPHSKCYGNKNNVNLSNKKKCQNIEAKISLKLFGIPPPLVLGKQAPRELPGPQVARGPGPQRPQGPRNPRGQGAQEPRGPRGPTFNKNKEI